MSTARPVAGRPRQVVNGGLLGVCLLFLLATLGLPHLDAALTFAAWAFVLAIVPLGYGFLVASFEFPAEDVAVWHMRYLGCASQVADILGMSLVFAGVLGLVAHVLSATAVILVIVEALMLIGLVMLGSRWALGVPRSHRQPVPSEGGAEEHEASVRGQQAANSTTDPWQRSRHD